MNDVGAMINYGDHNFDGNVEIHPLDQGEGVWAGAWTLKAGQEKKITSFVNRRRWRLSGDEYKSLKACHILRKI
jgi:hypothetical protein